MGDRLNGRQKAAILLVNMGPELASQVFKHLRDDEVEDLTLEIANMRKVDPTTRRWVVEEFQQLYKAHEFIGQGGIEYARELLEKTFGAQKANEILERLTASLQIRPFDFARRTDPTQLVNFIQNEHPQTIALIMAYLNPDQAAVILSSLAPSRQAEVAKRLATLDQTAPEVVSEVEAVLEKKLANFVIEDVTAAGGIPVAVEILNRVDRGTEKTIMESLEENDPDLAEEIKKRMFVFEDIASLDDRSIQRVIREVDSRDWALSLKTGSEDVAERIFKNMSSRAREMLKEEIEFLGPVRVRDIEEAQQRIVNLVRKLDDAGEVIIARGGEDEIVV